MKKTKINIVPGDCRPDNNFQLYYKNWIRDFELNYAGSLINNTILFKGVNIDNAILKIQQYVDEFKYILLFLTELKNIKDGTTGYWQDGEWINLNPE